MQYHRMDAVFIDIYNIRNLTDVKISDVSSRHVDNKTIVIPALTVIYDNGKILSLTAEEKYFTTFVKKVVEVYNDEENNILENNLTDPFGIRRTINIDENTRRILRSGKLENINELYKFYENKCSYESSLLFQVDEVKLLIEMVKYHVSKFLSNSDINISFNDKLMGYKGHYTLEGNVNGIDKIFKINFYKISDNKYKFMINGILDNHCPMDVNISFNNMSIDVDVDIPEYELFGTYKYTINSDKVRTLEKVNKKQTCILYKNLDLQTCEHDLGNISSLDNNESFTWFLLPWNAYYGINNKITEVSENEKVTQAYTMYLYATDEAFMRKEKYIKSYKRNDTVSVIARTVTLDEMIKNTLGVCLSKKEGLYVIETSFKDGTSTTGYYDEMLNGKYFYHLVQSGSGIKSITRDEVVAIDDSVVRMNTDLLYSENLMHLIPKKL